METAQAEAASQGAAKRASFFGPRARSSAKDDCASPRAHLRHPSQEAWAAALCFAVGVALYANALEGDLVFDDVMAVTQNQDVVGASTSLGAIFAHDYWGTNISSASSHKSYRPLTVLSFRLNFLHGALQPWGYHAVNVLLHGAVSALVFVLAASELVALRPSAALAAGLLFAVHPVHTEAVAGIVGRAELLAAALAITGILVCCGSARGGGGGSVRGSGRCCGDGGGVAEARLALPLRPAFLTGLALLVAAFLCKESALAVLPLVVAHDWMSQPAVAPEGNARWRQWFRRRVGCVAVLAIALVLARAALTHEHTTGRHGLVASRFRELDNPLPTACARHGPLVCWLSIAHVGASYFALLLDPRQLCCDYSFDALPTISGLADARNARALLLSAALLAVLQLAARSSGSAALLARRRRLVLALLWAALPFAPASNVLFHPGTLLAERLLYLPSIGFCLLLGEVVQWALEPPSPPPTPPDSREVAARQGRQGKLRDCGGSIHRSLVLLLGFFVLGFWGALTVFRNADWRSQASLFEAALRVAPRSAKVQLNAGIDAWRTKRWVAAERHLKRASSILPSFCQPNYWHGRVLLDSGRHQQSLPFFQRALSCREQRHDAFAREALHAMYKEYVRLSPNDATARSNLGSVLLLQGRLNAAAKELKRALKLQPTNSEAMSNLGNVLLERKQWKKAASVLRAALRINPALRQAKAALRKIAASAKAKAKQKR